MSNLGVVVRMRPEFVPVVLRRASALAGVDVALNPGDGRLVMVLEDTQTAGLWQRAAQTLADIAAWPEVLNTALAYEYSGPDAAGAEPDDAGNFGRWRESHAKTRN